MFRGFYFVCGIWLFPGVLAMPMIPFEGDTYESDFIHSLTSQMVTENRIETLAVYGVNREWYRLRTVVAKSIVQSLMEEFQVPIVVWGLRRNITLRHLLGYKTLICVSTFSMIPDVDPIFDVLTDGLVGLHYVPMLFIYKHDGSATPTRNRLEAFFDWCWQQRFTHVFLTFQTRTPYNQSEPNSRSGRNEIFSYTPFPNLTIRNLTQTGYHLVDIMMNLRGYEFRVPTFQDPPNVFQLPNGRLSGAMGLLFSSYVHHRRGTLRLEPQAHMDRYSYQEQEHLMLAPARGEIEMGVHPYSPMQLNSSLTAGSFPLGTTNTCVLVPWQRVSPQVRFMQVAAHINGPFLLILLLAMTLCWQFVRGRWRRGVHLTFVTFFQQSVPNREFRHLPEPYKCIHVALLLSSLVLWTMRTAKLSSVFTSQINTAKDLLATPLRLMLTETEVEMYFTAGLLPSALMPRLLVVNKTTLMEHLDSLNSSYAYCTTAEHWSVVMLQQRRMHRPPFRLASQLCTTPKILRFPVQRNSPFERNFYRFGIHSLQFGLA
ncbi:uncharacterized protein LOC108026525 [Drosophila biarmipes]|uniref:uncharacterized protein LOC108026525 n=1 Tax=Drosophila biarmipes TaxID=125945 RepID=UPI0007E7849E|nr:uncharacterized protein LOC108026525 [Drosophila biarmipes]